MQKFIKFRKEEVVWKHKQTKKLELLTCKKKVFLKQLKKNCISLNEHLSRVEPLTGCICLLNATWTRLIILKKPTENSPISYRRGGNWRQNLILSPELYLYDQEQLSPFLSSFTTHTQTFPHPSFLVSH